MCISPWPFKTVRDHNSEERYPRGWRLWQQSPEPLHQRSLTPYTNVRPNQKWLYFKFGNRRVFCRAIGTLELSWSHCYENTPGPKYSSMHALKTCLQFRSKTYIVPIPQHKPFLSSRSQIPRKGRGELTGRPNARIALQPTAPGIGAEESVRLGIFSVPALQARSQGMWKSQQRVRVENYQKNVKVLVKCM